MYFVCVLPACTVYMKYQWRPDLELGKVVSHHEFWELNPVPLEEQQLLSINWWALSPAHDKLISKEKKYWIPLGDWSDGY